jgi:hypothetical protein
MGLATDEEIDGDEQAQSCHGQQPHGKRDVHWLLRVQAGGWDIVFRVAAIRVGRPARSSGGATIRANAWNARSEYGNQRGSAWWLHPRDGMENGGGKRSGTST